MKRGLFAPSFAQSFIFFPDRSSRPFNYNFRTLINAKIRSKPHEQKPPDGGLRTTDRLAEWLNGRLAEYINSSSWLVPRMSGAAESATRAGSMSWRAFKNATATPWHTHTKGKQKGTIISKLLIFCYFD